MEIFLLEDDQSIVALLKKYLSNDFIIYSFEDLEKARAFLKTNIKPKIFILDENLPDGKGTDLCLDIRNTYSHKMYIMILTITSDINNKLKAYQLGADDYIVKPVDMLEIAAKLKNVSLKLNDEIKENFKLDNLYFDFSQMEVFLITGEVKKPLQLTPKQFLILKLLAMNADKIFSREKILQFVWGDNTNVTDRTVDQHIAQIRRKLSGSKVLLTATRGEGYRLVIKS